MFLRATEMNPTDMSLGGFFDVNRTLFKSVRFQLEINSNFRQLTWDYFVLVVGDDGYLFGCVVAISNQHTDRCWFRRRLEERERNHNSTEMNRFNLIFN